MNTEATRKQILGAIDGHIDAKIITILVDAYATLAESDRQDAIVAAQIAGGCYEPYRGSDDFPSEVG